VSDQSWDLIKPEFHPAEAHECSDDHGDISGWFEIDFKGLNHGQKVRLATYDGDILYGTFWWSGSVPWPLIVTKVGAFSGDRVTRENWRIEVRG
jgi:hypothetical protein